MRILVPTVVIALPTACLGCNLLGPSASFDGEWSAQGPGHSSYFGMSLQQNGDQVIGVACAFDSGVRLYSNAPVNGDHPHFRMVVTEDAANPCCPWFVGQSYTGTIEDRGEIVAHAGMTDLRFKRIPEPACP